MRNDILGEANTVGTVGPEQRCSASGRDEQQLNEEVHDEMLIRVRELSPSIEAYNSPVYVLLRIVRLLSNRNSGSQDHNFTG